MPLADARAMHPKIAVAQADAQADFALLEAIADWCDRYTPLVGLDPPDGLTLDISGCAHLFGGEAALARDLMRRLDARRTAGARRGRRNGRMCVGREPLCGPEVPGPLRRRAGRPLPPPPRGAASLRPTRSKRSRRSGSSASPTCSTGRARRSRRASAPDFVRRLDQALGIEDEPITPRLPVPAALAEQRFPEPIAHERDVLGTIERLAARLGPVLEQRGEGARLLQVALFRADGKVFRVEAGTAAPLRDPARIARLFADRLDGDRRRMRSGLRLRHGAAVARWSPSAAIRSRPAWRQPDHAADLAHLIDRLGARFGLRRVTRLVPQDTHIPEFAVMAVAARCAHPAHPAQAGSSQALGPRFRGTSGDLHR